MESSENFDLSRDQIWLELKKRIDANEGWFNENGMWCSCARKTLRPMPWMPMIACKVSGTLGDRQIESWADGWRRSQEFAAWLESPEPAHKLSNFATMGRVESGGFLHGRRDTPEIFLTDTPR